jgi:hypothetical protein
MAETVESKGPQQTSRARKNAALVALVLVTLGVAGSVALWASRRRASPAMCPGTPALLASLHAPIVVDAYVTRGTPELDAFVDTLQALLAEYKAQGNGRFDYHVVVTNDDGSRAQAKARGLTQAPLSPARDGAAALGYMGLAFKYGAAGDVIPLLTITAPRAVGFWIDNKVRELRAKVDGSAYRIGVLTGHGEIPLDEANLVPPDAHTKPAPSIKGILAQNFPFYSFRDVDLRGGSVPIDPELDGLIVTQPSSDLTDAELARVDELVLHGTPVAFFVSAANVRLGDSSMHATLSAHGLERLLAGYGIEVGRDLVVELEPKLTPSGVVDTLKGLAHYNLPFVPLVREEDHRLDSAFPVFLRMTEVAFPLASSLTLHPDKQPGAKLREIARTSPRSVRVTGDDIDLHPLGPWTPSGAEGAVVVAAAAQGTLRGAFDPSHTGRGRVLVVASSQFLANPLARAAYEPPATPVHMPIAAQEALKRPATSYAQNHLTVTILAVKNTLDWLSSGDDAASCGDLLLAEKPPAAR